MAFQWGISTTPNFVPAKFSWEEDGNVRMIRRAERPEDYFATLYGFDFEK